MPSFYEDPLHVNCSWLGLETRPGLPIAAEAKHFGPSLLNGRTAIERHFGDLGNFGGGLKPLPNWVRRPRWMVLWVAAKLVINGMRICKNKGVAA